MHPRFLILPLCIILTVIPLAFAEDLPEASTDLTITEDVSSGTSEISSDLSVSSSEESVSSESSVSSASSYSSPSSYSSFSSFASLSSSASSASSQPLLINELLPDPVGSDDFEWIELFNDSPETLDISGFLLDSGTSTSFALPVGSIMEPGHTMLLSRSLTHLSLPNGGGTVHLKDPSGALLDTLAYPGLSEGISFGRSPQDHSDQRFCVPTPDATNSTIPLNVSIVLQSGETVGEGKVTMNLQATASNGTLSDAICVFDYGDGFVSQSCNPNSHTISKIGDSEVSLRVTDQCGITVEQTLPYHVTMKPSSSSQSSQSDDSDEEEDPQPISVLASTAGLSCPFEGIGKVHLSEFLPDPDGSDDNEWIELWNEANDTINLCGWQLDDAEGGSKPFPLDGISISPKQYLVLPRERTGLALNNTKESVRLLAPVSGSTDHQVLEMISYEKSEAEKSYARRQDGTFAWTDLLTPGRANQFIADITLSGTVTRVIDGDTVDVRLDAPAEILNNKQDITVRMIGIDTPETVDPRKPVQAYGKQASNFTRALIEGKKVELLFDSDLYDVYDRVLAYLQLPGGSLVQEKLLEQGLAFAYIKYPFSRKDAFLALQEEAKSKKLNLWSDSEAQTYAEKAATEEMKDIPDQSALTGDDELDQSFSGTLILLSEIYPHPYPSSSKKKGSEGIHEEWIELQNYSSKEIDLAGWSLDDDQDGGSKPYVFQKNSLLHAGSFLLVPKSQSKLSLNDDRDAVVLLRPDGMIAGALQYEKIPAGVSMSLHDESWCVSDHPTPGSDNICKSGSALTKAIASILPGSPMSVIPVLSGKSPAKVKTGTKTSFLAKNQSDDISDVFGEILEQSNNAKEPLWKPSLSIFVAFMTTIIVGIGLGLGWYSWRKGKFLL